MHLVIFRDAAGKEVFRSEDHSLTLLPVTKAYAVASAMKAFNDAVKYGRISAEAARSWVSLSVHHAYGWDRVGRDEAEDIFSRGQHSSVGKSRDEPVILDHCWLPDGFLPPRLGR